MRRQSTDSTTCGKLFGTEEPLLPLWIAEPTLPPLPELTEALRARAAYPYWGYELQPDELNELFWNWTCSRHTWLTSNLHTIPTPSVGTGLATLIDTYTKPKDNIVAHTPAFTEYRPLVHAAGRRFLKSRLIAGTDGYSMDMDHLESLLADPQTSMLILCNPHNPTGAIWSPQELAHLAEIATRHGVFVFADEIHADITLPAHQFHPFANAASSWNLRWAAAHGPLKTFGTAGLSSSILITDHDRVADTCRRMNTKYRLIRTQSFDMATFAAVYKHGGPWVDSLLRHITEQRQLLQQKLPERIKLVPAKGTYLAWLDIRELDIEPNEVATTVAKRANIALAPGHWFGRSGTGYVRMTLAAPATDIQLALEGLHRLDADC